MVDGPSVVGVAVEVSLFSDSLLVEAVVWLLTLREFVEVACSEFPELMVVKFSIVGVDVASMELLFCPSGPAVLVEAAFVFVSVLGEREFVNVAFSPDFVVDQSVACVVDILFDMFDEDSSAKAVGIG